MSTSRAHSSRPRRQVMTVLGQLQTPAHPTSINNRLGTASFSQLLIFERCNGARRISKRPKLKPRCAFARALCRSVTQIAGYPTITKIIPILFSNPETGSGEEKLLKRDFYVTGWLMNFLIFTQKKGREYRKSTFYFDTKLLRTFGRKKVNVKHLCWLAQNPAHIQFQGIQRKSFDSMEMFLDEVFMIKTQKDRRGCESGMRGACAPLLY